MFCNDNCEEIVCSFVLLFVWCSRGFWDIFLWLVVGRVVVNDIRVMLELRVGMLFVRSCFLMNLL